MSDARISLAIASHDTNPFLFTFDAIRLAIYTAANLPPGVGFDSNAVSGTYVHAARQRLLQHLIKIGTTHILWMDSDMQFPRDALFRLLAHRKAVVGINYATRHLPNDFVALKRVSTLNGGSSARLVTNTESTGLEEVDALGFGLVLMRVESILPALPPLDKEPWFWFEWLGEQQQQVGEDVYFCRLLRRAGIPIYVDHDLSKECGHLGTFNNKLEHAQLFRESMPEIPTEFPTRELALFPADV